MIDLQEAMVFLSDVKLAEGILEIPCIVVINK